MFFSEKFRVSKEKIKEYGAFDILMVCDLPLFIDPILIFNSPKEEYKKLHEQIIKYFAFLANKSIGTFCDHEIKYYLMFPEVKQNWLGLSLFDNSGKGMGNDFAKFLANNLHFLIKGTNIGTRHIERVLLVYEGNGRDKISDLTVNLILDYLATYTQNFALNNIDKSLLKKFTIDRAIFDYESGTWISKEYILPCINDKGKDDFVLLTPLDILRKGDPEISRPTFLRHWKDIYERIRNIPEAKDNSTIWFEFTNHIELKIKQYKEERIAKNKTIKLSELDKKRKEYFCDLIKDARFSPIFDLYIEGVEGRANEIINVARRERIEQINACYDKPIEIFKTLCQHNCPLPLTSNSRDECIKRIIYFKDCIENKEVYQCLYSNGKPVSNEDFLQRLFRLVLYGTKFDFNFETNNGGGELDAKASYGSNDKCIIEFKLASNSKISHLFKQTKRYELANASKESLFVIFFFSKRELEKLEKLMNENDDFNSHKDSIFLIDCSLDNKISASKL